jgi:hypothetical protein
MKFDLNDDVYVKGMLVEPGGKEISGMICGFHASDCAIVVWEEPPFDDCMHHWHQGTAAVIDLDSLTKAGNQENYTTGFNDAIDLAADILSSCSQTVRAAGPIRALKRKV